MENEIRQYYKLIGDEALFLFVGKSKVNLTIRENKINEFIIYSHKNNLPETKPKECCHVPKEFFHKNFEKQDSWIEVDNKPTLEKNIEEFKTANDTIKTLMLEFAKEQNTGNMPGKRFSKYIAKIRKEFDIMNVIQPTIKHLKREQAIDKMFEEENIL